MAATIDDTARALLDDKHFVHVTTLNSDGTPHTAVVWGALDGDEIQLNSAAGRTWPTNLERDPRVWLTVVNLENPYQYVSVRGEVVEITEQDADEHIDALAKKYLDEDSYPFRRPDEVRLKIRIRPDRVKVQGG